MPAPLNSVGKHTYISILTKKVLYISYDGLTDPLGQSQILPYIIGLTRYGYHFTVISCEKKELFESKRSRIAAICEKENIFWSPIMYTKKPPVFSTIWDIIKISKRARHLHSKKTFEIIHCRSYISSLVGLKFKRKYKTKFVFDMRGLWADERVDGNLWDLSNPIYRNVFKYFKKKERQFLLESDQVISLTNAAKKEILSWDIPGVRSEKIQVIPCAADFDLFILQTEESRLDARKKLGLNDIDFVLTYIGSLGTWYLLDEMLHYFSLIKWMNAHAKFLILTKDADLITLETIKKFNLEPEDIIVRFGERKEIPLLAHASDWGLFFIKPSYSKISSSPTKMGEILAMGIPVICNSHVGDVEQIVNESKSGICLTNLDQETMVNSMSLLLQTKYKPSEIRQNVREYFDLPKCVDSYLKSYSSLDFKT